MWLFHYGTDTVPAILCAGTSQCGCSITEQLLYQQYYVPVRLNVAVPYQTDTSPAICCAGTSQCGCSITEQLLYQQYYVPVRLNVAVPLPNSYRTGNTSQRQVGCRYVAVTIQSETSFLL